MYLRSLYSVVLCTLVTPVTLSVAGCQKEDDPLTRDEFCGKWADAVCGSEVLSVCQTSASECEMSQAASCRSWLPDTFQDDGVDACLSAVKKAYADADLDAKELDIVWRLSAPCNSIVLAGEGGETCERDADCSGSTGLTCVLKDRATGTCERAVEEQAGFACDEPQQTCEPGFFCNGENCIVTAELGESCNNDNQCGEGLFCENELCETQLPVGSDCTTDRECDSEICYAVDTNERVCVDRIRLSPAEPACDSLK
jgi:hypothetical protein